MQSLNGHAGVGASTPTPTVANGLPRSPSVTSTDSTTNVQPLNPPVSAKVQLYRKLAAVYKAVRYIQKDRKNDFHGYRYASEAAIKDKLHEAFVENGLILLPPIIDEVRDESREEKDSRGNLKVTLVTTIKVRFKIADVDTGEEVEGQIYGRGVDPLDKGIYKSITGALKYHLTTAFLIPTGDDPEADEGTGGNSTGQTKPEPQRGRQPRQPRPPQPPPPTPPAPVRPAASAPLPQPPVPAGPNREQWFAFSRDERIQAFRDMERSLNPDLYCQILERHGVGDPRQFRSANAAFACYAVLWQAVRNQADSTRYEHHVAQEGRVA